jgi:CubicO group peptidase (beta-lactamase class C family)
MTPRAVLAVLALALCAPAPGQAGPARPAPVPRPLPPDVSWVDAPPPEAEALAADPTAFAELLERNGLALDPARGVLALRGAVLHDEASLAGYPIEYLVVTERGRTHEALLLVKASPSLVDACLRALGAAPGSPMHFAPREPPPSREELEAGATPWVVVPPAGALVDVRVAFTGPDGAPREVPLESTLLDLRTGEVLSQRDWAYTGSTFGPLRQGLRTVQVFQGDAQGNVIGISPLDRGGAGACVLERNSGEGADDSLYGVNGALAPPRGTPVTLLLRPTGARTLPAAGPRPEELVDGEDGARLDAWLSRAAAFGFSGVVLAERDGRVVLHKGWGLADRTLDLPVTTATVFPISSISKQFTAAAILQLEAAGELRLDDIIARHLDEVPEDKKAVTLRHLLHHVSGLPEQAATPGGGEPGTLGSDRRATVRRILGTPLVSAPGAAFRYSNLGYALLAAVVESAADDIYRGYLGERLLGPAGLTSAGLFGEPRWSAERLARGLSGPPGAQQPAPQPAYGPLTWEQVGAGAVVCSARDLQRWVHALRDGTLLPEAQRQAMFTPAAGGYGCAWWIEDDGERGRVAWHDGLLPGYRAEVRCWLDAGATVIVAGNTELHGLAAPLGRLLFGEPVPLPPATAAPDPASAAALAGEWQAGDVRLQLRAPADDPGALWAVPLTQPALDLLDGAGGGERARRAKFGARTVAFLVAVANARWDECAAVLGPSTDATDCEQTFGPWWSRLGEGLGAPVGPHVLAVGDERGALAVDVEVQYAGGAARRRVLWRDGELADIRLPGGALGTRRLLPAEQGGWTSWSLEQGAGPVLRALDAGGEAGTPRLQLASPDGSTADLTRVP